MLEEYTMLISSWGPTMEVEMVDGEVESLRQKAAPGVAPVGTHPGAGAGDAEAQTETTAAP